MTEASLHGEEEASGYGTFRFYGMPGHGDRIVVGRRGTRQS
jgi:hypothetical protein